jgi:CBS-domain-containing membrane protein
MAQHHIRHVPIVAEQRRLVGLVSQCHVPAAADSNLLADLDDSDMVEGMIALSSIMTLDVRT